MRENIQTKQKEVTVLLVEDDDVDAMAIKRAFTKHRIGNPVVRAKDGLEALELLNEGLVYNPYIILLDLAMPRMGGLEFLEVVRKDPNLEASVIFVLTTSASDEDITASYQQHIAGYFIKQGVGENFVNVVNLLDGYWKIVHLPELPGQ